MITVVSWVIKSQDLFNLLQEKAIYPDPAISGGAVFQLVGLLAGCCCAVLGHLLKKIYPEDDDYDDDEDDVDYANMAAEKQYFQGGPQMPQNSITGEETTTPLTSTAPIDEAVQDQAAEKQYFEGMPPMPQNYISEEETATSVTSTAPINEVVGDQAEKKEDLLENQ